MQTNATQAQGEQLMGTDTGFGAIDAFQNPDNFGRFKVWKDKTYVMGDQSAVYDGTNMEFFGQMRQFKWNIKFKKPIVVNFNATNGGTVADIVDNSFHLIAVSTSALQGVNINYVCRVPFYE